MTELLWIVVGIVLGLIAEHLVLPWTIVRARSYGQTQRLRHFPQLRNGLAVIRLVSDLNVFRASEALYESGPAELLDEVDDVLEWLREDQYTEPDVEEIYIVARRRFRPRSIEGVLYASLYREFSPTRAPDKPRSACFVSVACANELLPEPRKLEVAHGLWTKLCDEIRTEDEHEEEHEASCDLYFQFPARGEGDSDSQRSFYWTLLCDVAKAKRIRANYSIPEFDDRDQLRTCDGVLLHARLGSSRQALDAREVVEFVYGVVHLWAFGYQGEASGFALDRLRARTEALLALSDDLARQANPAGEFEVEPCAGTDVPDYR